MRHPFIRSIIAMTLLFGLLAGIFWLSCTEQAPLDPTDTEGADAALLTSMTVSPAQLLAGGTQATVRVRLIDLDGQGIAGESVTFTTTLGSVVTAATTDATGWAQAILTTGTESGQATITARYGTNVSSSVNADIISASESRIQMSVARSSILASGADTTLVTVTVMGDSSDTVSGATVTFGTTAGSITSSAITDGSGQATAILTSAASRNDAVATVTAQYDTTALTSTVAYRGVTLDVTANPTALQADGESKSTVQAVIKETATYVAVANAKVTFSTDHGLIPNEAVTNSSGVASVELTAASTEGTAHVVTRFGQLTPDTLLVAMTNSTPANYVLSSLTVANAHVLANGVDQTTVSARVADDQGNAAAGVAVSFAASSGEIASSLVTDSNGLVTATVIAPASETDIDATITATLGSQIRTAPVAFDGIEMQISAIPDTILSDGQSQSTVRVVLKETTSKVAVADAVVRFGATSGTIPAQIKTDASGVAAVALTSGTSPATSTITARYGQTISKETRVVFSDQAPTQYVLSRVDVSETAVLGNGVAQSTITATVLDDEGQVVSGATVGFGTNVGSIDLSAVTGGDGRASAVFTAPALTADAQATVTVTLNQQSMTKNITVEGLLITLAANPTSIIANGQSTAEITATVKKSANNVAVSGAVIVFGTSRGTIPNSKSTDEAGVARVDLTSSSQQGTAQVTAQYGTLSATPVTVTFELSEATNLQVTTTPPVIVADGQSQSQIKAMVTDANNNPVPDGTVVTFELGSGDTGSLERHKSTVNGVATSLLTASTTPEEVSVTVSVNGISRTVTVEYVVGAASQVTVRADSTSISADGLSNTAIRARVLDAQGSPIPGITVFFTTNLGDVTPSAQTDGTGYADATFSSGEVGAAFITASVNTSSGGTVSGSVTVVAVPGQPNSIVLRFTPTAIGVKETGQNQTSIIEAEVRDAKNNPVADGVEVVFEIEAQPGEAVITPTEPVPTVGGIARASLSSGTISGNVRIRATVNTSGGPIAKASEILIHAGPPYMEDRADYASTHLTIAADQLNIWRTLGTTTVSIAVFDRYHNPVQEGTAVYLTTSGGGISTHTAYTDDQGKASVILTGANPQPTIHKYYHGDLMQDPNPDLLGVHAFLPVPYPVNVINGESLIPDFDDNVITNSMADSIGTIFQPVRYSGGADYTTEENDGVARIIAYTEGHDLAGAPVRAWDQITVVYSGAVSYDDDSATSLANASLDIGDSRTMIFTLMDDNGNPIESRSTIKAELTNDVDAKLSWNEINTGDGWGQVYYSLTITNNVDPADTDPSLGSTYIKISWDGEHQFGNAITVAGVVITAN